MAIEPFVWGKGGRKMTPKDIERSRIEQALMRRDASDTSPVGHWSAALNRALQGYIVGRDRRQADSAETEGRASGQDAIIAALGGGMSAPASQPMSAMDGASGGSSFMDSLINSESGGNWGALNNEGYGGRLQFGAARLADAARAGIIPAGIDGAAFSRLPPEQQMAVEQWHFNDIDQQAQRMGLDQFIGQNVGGVPITQDAIRGMAHLGGIGGTAKFLQSGGQYNPADSNGTSLRDYGLRHGGSGRPAPPQSGPSSAQIATLMSDPWAMEVGGPVINALLGQTMQNENAALEQQRRQADPMYQAQLQAAQLANQRAMQPAPNEYDVRAAAAAQYGLQPNTPEFQRFVLGMGEGSDTPADYRALELRAEAAGLEPGTPEFKDFMRTAGRATNAMPAAVAALHERAVRSGLIPGTPEYENFMLTGGKAVEAGAAVTGKTEAEMALAAPLEINSAEDTLRYIEEIRNHPGREWGTGMSSWTGMIPGTDAYDFATRVDQLGGGAFLTAIGEMQGMGALSNQEGQTAKAAIARLSRAQSEGEFMAALADYERIINRGRERAMKRLKVTDSVPEASRNETESDDDFLKRMGLQ